MKLSERDAKIVSALNNGRQIARIVQGDATAAMDELDDGERLTRISDASVEQEALLAECVRLLTEDPS